MRISSRSMRSAHNQKTHLDTLAFGQYTWIVIRLQDFTFDHWFAIRIRFLLHIILLLRRNIATESICERKRQNNCCISTTTTDEHAASRESASRVSSV